MREHRVIFAGAINYNCTKHHYPDTNSPFHGRDSLDRVGTREREARAFRKTGSIAISRGRRRRSHSSEEKEAWPSKEERQRPRARVSRT